MFNAVAGDELTDEWYVSREQNRTGDGALWNTRCAEQSTSSDDRAWRSGDNLLGTTAASKAAHQTHQTCPWSSRSECCGWSYQKQLINPSRWASSSASCRSACTDCRGYEFSDEWPVLSRLQWVEVSRREKMWHESCQD